MGQGLQASGVSATLGMKTKSGPQYVVSAFFLSGNSYYAVNPFFNR
jgi:hypothetical protein